MKLADMKFAAARLWPYCDVVFPATSMIHGKTVGKRYRFRADCDECMDEVCERVMLHGVRTDPEPPHWINLRGHDTLVLQWHHVQC